MQSPYFFAVKKPRPEGDLWHPSAERSRHPHPHPTVTQRKQVHGNKEAEWWALRNTSQFQSQPWPSQWKHFMGTNLKLRKGKHWVGQKSSSEFSKKCYGKPQTNFLANPVIYLLKSHGESQCQTQFSDLSVFTPPNLTLFLSLSLLPPPVHTIYNPHLCFFPSVYDPS